MLRHSSLIPSRRGKKHGPEQAQTKCPEIGSWQSRPSPTPETSHRSRCRHGRRGAWPSHVGAHGHLPPRRRSRPPRIPLALNSALKQAQQIAALNNEIETTKAEVESLEEKNENLRDPAYIKRKAREDQYYVERARMRSSSRIKRRSTTNPSPNGRFASRPGTLSCWSPFRRPATPWRRADDHRVHRGGFRCPPRPTRPHSRGVVGIAARSTSGEPLVVATAPRLEDGTPFPTTFYLTHPAYVAECSRLEASGIMAEWTTEIGEDDELAAAYAAAHRAYLDVRSEIGSAAGLAEVEEIKDYSAGGMPNRVKCLHALVGHSLYAGLGVNPIGDRALSFMNDAAAGRDRCHHRIRRLGPAMRVAAFDCGTNSCACSSPMSPPTAPSLTCVVKPGSSASAKASMPPASSHLRRSSGPSPWRRNSPRWPPSTSRRS